MRMMRRVMDRMLPLKGGQNNLNTMSDAIIDGISVFRKLKFATKTSSCSSDQGKSEDIILERFDFWNADIIDKSGSSKCMLF